MKIKTQYDFEKQKEKMAKKIRRMILSGEIESKIDDGKEEKGWIKVNPERKD